MRTTYEVRAERDGDWWLLSVPAVRGAVSQARRVSDVDDYIRDAIAYVLGVSVDSFDITVHPVAAESELDSASA
ncbi:MAG: hypothetical protein ABIM89_08480 [Mycobacteriales bacterium]